MMVVFITVLSLLAVVGLQYLIKELICRKMCRKVCPEKIIICTHNSENEIEYLLRTVRMQYPESDIAVHDINSSDKTAEIVRRMNFPII